MLVEGVNDGNSLEKYPSEGVELGTTDGKDVGLEEGLYVGRNDGLALQGTVQDTGHLEYMSSI